jgi:hypothetical protein
MLILHYPIWGFSEKEYKDRKKATLDSDAYRISVLTVSLNDRKKNMKLLSIYHKKNLIEYIIKFVYKYGASELISFFFLTNINIYSS